MARVPAERQEDLQEKVRERLGEGAEIQEALADAAAEAENFVDMEPEDGEVGRPVEAGELAKDTMDYFLDRGGHDDPTSDSEQAEAAAARYCKWRGTLVYDIYRRMGGSRSRAEVSKVFDQEVDVSEYKNMVGGWMKTLLEAEGQTPGAMVLDCLKHPVGRMTRDKWAACLAAEVEEAGEAEESEEDAPRDAAPAALSDSERSREEDVEAELQPKRRRLHGKQPRPIFLERFVGPGLAAAAALACSPGPLRRPAARAARPNECCAGADGRACSFSTTALGAPATVHPRRGQLRCLFCSDGRLDDRTAIRSPERCPPLEL